MPMKLKLLDLFSGIGGFSLSASWTGEIETVAFCEIDPFCRQVLKKHWPDVPIFDDVTKLTKEKLDAAGIGAVDIITGGFPCQDLSVAGALLGFGGKRSSLFMEIIRLYSELRPKYIVFENVANLLSGDYGRWFERFLSKLAEVGLDAEWHCIPASAINAKHHRDRVWVVSYPVG